MTCSWQPVFPQSQGSGIPGPSRLLWYPWSPRWKAYLYCIDLEIDRLSAHANVVGDDIQDEGVYSLGSAQGGRL